VYPAVKASALPTANLDFIGLSFGAIFETKPAPALAVGIQFIGSTASDRKSVVRLVGLCPLFQRRYCFSICSLQGQVLVWFQKLHQN
jgi:hypothetical protein